MDDLLFQVVRLVLAVLCAVALIRGGGPERLGAAIMFADYLGRSILNGLGFQLDYYSPSTAHLIHSFTVFSASLILSITSNRVWPLFFSAFALVQFSGHLSVMILQDGFSRAYWALVQIPIILQAFVIFLGMLAFLQRRKVGFMVTDWRLKSTI